jgi:Tol biopolymer transport system component
VPRPGSVRGMRRRLARFSITLGACALGSGALVPSPAGATFHGHNGRIAWASFVSDGKAGGVTAIATFSAGGGGIHRISSCSDVNDVGDPIYCQNWDRISYSPDGRRLMWDMTAVAGNEVIVLANADGRAPHVIDHGSTENDFEPTFSPGGDRIAYVRGAAGSEGQIVTSNLAGGDLQVVTTTMTGFSPAWAPNGKTILFVHNTDIWSIGINGQAPRLLIPNGQDPDFSPNGHQIVYLNNGGFAQTFGTLYLARADGTHRHKVPTTGHCCKLVQSVVFSPDGKRLAFGLLSNDTAENLLLSTLPIAGGRPTPIYSRSTNFNGGFTNSLSWQPRR